MLDTKPSNLWDELESSKTYIKKCLSHRETIVNQYHGPYWGDQDIDAQTRVENHPFEFISLILPQIVYNNPRVTVNSARTTPVHRMVASALQQGLNRWIKDAHLATLLRHVCFDFLTGWGVVLTTFEENPRVSMPKSMKEKKGFDHPMWPIASRVSPTDFFFDPRAQDPSTCRWMAHRRLWDIEDLIEEAENGDEDGWDLAAVKALQAGEDENIDSMPFQGPDRKQVYVYEVWIPEDTEENEKNEHGTLYTIAKSAAKADKSGEPGFLRKARPYYGPETGPYTVFGAFYVGDEAAPLSPLLATYQQQKEADEFSAAFSQSARNYKNILITSSKKLAEAIQSADHQSVHFTEDAMYEDGRPRAMPVAYGGATREQLEGKLQASERLERVTGLSEAMKGQTSGGDTTATEEQIAFQSGSIRVEDLRERFTDCLTRFLTGVSWYMFTDEDFVIPIGGQQFGQHDIWFEGGAESGLVEIAGMSFYDLEATIEPYSMERISDSARMARLAAAAERTVMLGQAMPQMPWLNWEEIVQDIGNAYNLPDYSSRFNWQVLQQIWAQGGLQVQPAGQGEAKLASHTPPQSQGARLKPDMKISPQGQSAGQRAQQEAPRDAV